MSGRGRRHHPPGETAQRFPALQRPIAPTCVPKPCPGAAAAHQAEFHKGHADCQCARRYGAGFPRAPRSGAPAQPALPLGRPLPAPARLHRQATWLPGGPPTHLPQRSITVCGAANADHNRAPPPRRPARHPVARRYMRVSALAFERAPSAVLHAEYQGQTRLQAPPERDISETRTACISGKCGRRQVVAQHKEDASRQNRRAAGATFRLPKLRSAPSWEAERL